jgi:hypothetical protein
MRARWASKASSRSGRVPVPFRPLTRLAQNEERERAGREALRRRKNGAKKTAVTGKNRIMIFGPKTVPWPSVAKKIVRLAKKGERNPARLTEGVISSFRANSIPM